MDDSRVLLTRGPVRSGIPRRAVRAIALGLVAVLLGAAPADSARAAEPEAVRFETADGFTLHGDLVAASDPEAPAVILLHMYRSNRKAWAPLVPRLAEAGFTVLALDQRAHGESVRRGEKTVRVEAISREDFADVVRAGPKDVAAALRFLRERELGAGGLALVGASYGCTVSLLSAKTVEDVRALVLLSPGTSYFGIDVVEAAKAFDGLLLAVAAEDDPRSAESARRLIEAHAGPEELVVYPSGGHGTRLFAPRPDVMKRVVELLRDALR